MNTPALIWQLVFPSQYENTIKKLDYCHTGKYHRQGTNMLKVSIRVTCGTEPQNAIMRDPRISCSMQHTSFWTYAQRTLPCSTHIWSARDMCHSSHCILVLRGTKDTQQVTRATVCHEHRRHVQRCVTNTSDTCSGVSRTQATRAAVYHEQRRHVHWCVTNKGDTCSGVSRTQATLAAVCHEHRRYMQRCVTNTGPYYVCWTKATTVTNKRSRNAFDSVIQKSLTL
jgi:hypothetical protein